MMSKSEIEEVLIELAERAKRVAANASDAAKRDDSDLLGYYTQEANEILKSMQYWNEQYRMAKE